MADNTQLYGQVFQQLIGEYPEMAKFAPLIQQVLASQQDDSGPSQIDELEKKVKKLKHIVRSLKADLDDSFELLTDLGRALGACSDCFGSTPGCPTCGGHGTAGHYKIDKELFNELILPALNRVPWLDVKERRAATYES